MKFGVPATITTSALVKVVPRAELNLVGLAFRAERKVIDKVVDGLRFHT